MKKSLILVLVFVYIALISAAISSEQTNDSITKEAPTSILKFAKK